MVVRRKPPTKARPAISILKTFEHLADTSLMVPDIIEFAVSDAYLNRRLYPRQGTMLKIAFLQDDLFTDFDYRVIEEWVRLFESKGDQGCQPDIFERIKQCKEENRPWFREWINVIGRRGSKGFIGGVAGAYVLWNYMAHGDPQGYYGVDRDKRLAMMVFAGKKEQAVKNQWKDLRDVIKGGICFIPYISRSLNESLTVYAPYDFVRMTNRDLLGVDGVEDLATFEVIPKESTVMASRGPASFAQLYDEMAHVDRRVAKADAGEVYDSATPALDTFGPDAWIYEPSSPWQMIGKFFENWEQSLLHSDGEDGYEDSTGHQLKRGAIVRPEMLMFQLESWDPYKDWALSASIQTHPLAYPQFAHLHYPPHKRAMQEYDHQMKRLEAANPETFAVERRCLDPESRVLCADLTWRRIKELQIGDELVGLDEYPLESGKQRKLRVSVVENVGISLDVAYKISFDDGSHVICSGNHKWLSDRRWRQLYALPNTPGPREMLKIGDTIRTVVDPWCDIEPWTQGYLAGLYDGEGCLVNRNRERSEYAIQFSQNPGVVLDRTLECLEGIGFHPTRRGFDRKCQAWWLTNLDECLRFLGQVRPIRFMQYQRDLWVGKAIGGGRGSGASKTKTIVSIEKLSEQTLVDLQTSTGTFIAEGLVSHNSHWAAVQDAYLKPSFVERMFRPWPEDNPLNLEMRATGRMAVFYKAHGDPSKSGANFGFAIAHVEKLTACDECEVIFKHDEILSHMYEEHHIENPRTNAFPHVVFDVIHHWEPKNFEENEHEIDYEIILEDMKDYLKNFLPGEFTFDQGYSTWLIQQLRKYVREQRQQLPKAVNVFERTATAGENWTVAESFKTALGLGLIHAPPYEQARLELLFLTKTADMKVDHPTAGPVQTKDVADCIMILTHALIGDEIAAFIGETLSGLHVHGSAMGGLPTTPASSGDNAAAESAINGLRSFGAGRGRQVPSTPARGLQRSKRR